MITILCAIVGLKISYFLWANHSVESRCVICTVTLFVLVLHLNYTAPSQSESSNFFMFIIKAQIGLLIATVNCSVWRFLWISTVQPIGNKPLFCMKGFAWRLILKHRHKVNREWPIYLWKKNSVRFLLHSLERKDFSCCVTNSWNWLVCSPVTYEFTVGLSVFTILSRIPQYCRLMFKFLYYSIKFKSRSRVNQFHGKPSNKW